MIRNFRAKIAFLPRSIVEGAVPKPKDQVVRAMTNDGQFRVIAVQISDTCRESALRQKAPQDLLLRQAQLICASVLIRETMQPGNRVQLIWKDCSGHRLVADSMPDGKTRSIVNPGGEQDSRRQGLLQVHYTLRNGELHQGIVALNETESVNEVIMRYLQSSEQITAFVHLQCLLAEDGTLEVGGFVVQVTPETVREGLEAMTKHLQKFKDISPWLGSQKTEPAELVREILEGHEYAVLSAEEIEFGCTCSEERMLLGISTLPKTDLGEMLAEAKPLEISCDACGQHYEIGMDAVARIFNDSDKKTNAPSN